MTHSPIEAIVKGVSGVSLLALLATAVVSISYGVDDLAVMQVFSTDEPLAVTQVATNLANNDVNPRGFFRYGYLYHEVSYGWMRLLRYLDFDVSTRLIAVSMRAISLLAYLVLLYLTYRVFLQLVPRATDIALLGVVFLACIEQLYYWAQMVHPDLLSTALVVCSATIALSAHTAPRAVLAAAAAGFAFGVKYSGIFILPFCLVPYLLRIGSIPQGPGQTREWRLPIFVVFLALLVFTASWLVVNPYVLWDPHNFAAGFLYEYNRVQGGAASPSNPWHWFVVLYQQFGAWGSLLLTVGFALFLLDLRGRSRAVSDWREFFGSAQVQKRLTVILYVVTALTYLIVRVEMREERYLFHITPFIVLIAFAGLASPTPSSLVRTVYVAMISVMVFSHVLPTLASASGSSHKYDHPYIRAGKFLEATYPHDFFVVADWYSFIPSTFERQRLVYGVDERKTVRMKPDILVMNAEITGRWCWKAPGTRFRQREFVKGSDYDSSRGRDCSFLDRLFSERSLWQLGFEDTGIVVLVASGAPRRR